MVRKKNEENWPSSSEGDAILVKYFLLFTKVLYVILLLRISLECRYTIPREILQIWRMSLHDETNIFSKC